MKVKTISLAVLGHACREAREFLAEHCPDGLRLNAETLDRLSDHIDAIGWGEWLILDSTLCPAPLVAKYTAAQATLRAEYTAVRATLVAKYRVDSAMPVEEYDTNHAQLVAKDNADNFARLAKYRAYHVPLWSKYDTACDTLVRDTLLAWGGASVAVGD